MRYMILLWMLFIPCPGHSAVLANAPQPQYCLSGQFSTADKSMGHHGFVRKATAKMLLKYFKKNLKNPGYSDGRWFAIAGATIGLLVVASSLLATTLVTSDWRTYVLLIVLCAMAGLVLSIIGLIRARGWEKTWWIKALAIAGIVLTSLFSFVGWIVLRS